MPNFPQICLENVTYISMTVVEDLEFFNKSNCMDVCRLEVTTPNPSFEHWNYVKWEIIIGMSTVVSRSNNLEFKLGLVCWLKLHLNHLQTTKCYPRSKEGQYTQISWNHYFVIFWEALQFEVAVPQLCTFLIDLHPPTCRTTKSNGRCLGYGAFDYHANFQIDWESFAHRDQQKKHMFRICCPLERGCDNVKLVFVDWFPCNQLRAHSHVWINQKIANSIKSKLSTWQDIAYMNMNKSSWNNLEQYELVSKGSKQIFHNHIMVA